MTRIETLSHEEIEQIFVNSFIKKTYRARALFDLASTKKRSHFFRMLYIGNDFLNISPTHILPVVHPSQQNAAISQALRHHGARETAYVLPWTREDQSLFSLNEGIQRCLDSLEVSLLICNENLAFIQAEQDSGSRKQYILYKH